MKVGTGVMGNDLMGSTLIRYRSDRNTLKSKNWWDFLSVIGIKRFSEEEQKVSHINLNAPPLRDITLSMSTVIS